MTFTITVYETPDKHAKPEHRFVALIDFNGFKGRTPHLCSFTRAATYEEARRKGEDFVQATLNPEKKHKTPTDSATLQDGDELDNAAPAPEEDYPV